MNENNIMCPNCGSANMAGTSFCTQCGNALQMVAMNNGGGMQDQNMVNQQNTAMPQQNFNNGGMNNNVQQQNVNNNQTTTGSNEPLNIVQYLLGTLTKPFENFKKNEDKFDDVKNVSIISGIIVGIALVLSLLFSILNTVRVKNIFTGETTWVWDNVKEFPFFKFLGQRLVIFAGTLLLISVVYFLASRVLKKDTSFMRLLAASASAFFPFVIAINLLSPVLSWIFVELGLCVTVIGFFYTLIILLELVNYLINIEKGDIKIYVNAACTSIVVLVGGWIIYKMLLSELSSGLSTLF